MCDTFISFGLLPVPWYITKEETHNTSHEGLLEHIMAIKVNVWRFRQGWLNGWTIGTQPVASG